MNELIQIFDNQEVKIKTDKGVTLINLVHTAKCCGLIRNRNSNNIVIRWDDIKKKINTINSSVESSTPQYIDEISYILDEIDNTEDRNSIYMSSWLSKRLAMECKNDKAMKYKNFLATLDEARENGQLVLNNNVQIANMVSQVMNQVLPTLTKELATQFTPIILETKETVNKMAGLMHDQSEIYDRDREEIKNMIGIRAKQTKFLSEFLKDKLSDLIGENIKGTDEVYKKTRDKILVKHKALKWEDIAIGNYNKIHAYIDSLEKDDVKYY